MSRLYPLLRDLDVQVVQPKGHGFHQPQPEEIKAVFDCANWTQAEAARQLGSWA